MKELNYQTLFFVVLMLSLGMSTNMQAQGNKVRASQKSSVTQYVGNDTEITFTFSRPGVKDRTVWGEIVPYGLADGNKYSDNKPYPWRAGANENTTVKINKDVLVEGQKLPAGTYSIHMIPSEEKDWVVIFNKNSESWGSYKYNQKEDALRVNVTPVEAPHEEWLTYGFDDITDNSAVAYLHWEKLKVPFKVELAGK